MQPHRSSATLFALMFALLIAYASLYPFDGWRDQGINPFEFLNAPWPRYWSRFDVVANFVGYMPLGFLVALSLLRTRALPQPVLLASVAAALFSVLLEALQSYLPQRVPQLSDWLLNSSGALAGALTALALERWGVIDRWSRFRARWFVREARAPLVLLSLWPAALLFPPPVPLALGQIRERLQGFVNELLEGTPLAALVDESSGYVLPMSNLGELICVALGFAIPCLLAYSVTLGWHRRLMLWFMGVLIALSASSLSAALSYSPEHAWGWLSLAAQVGLGIGMGMALLCISLPRKLCLGLLVAALVWQMSLVNAVPATPYFAQTLQSWEQGSFIRFHGLAQWLGWLWPYAALVVALMALARRDTAMRR
jgi:VanZ family protein